MHDAVQTICAETIYILIIRIYILGGIFNPFKEDY